MKAILVTKHGGPDVLEYTEVADPVPAEGQLLVDVDCVGVNYIDTYFRSGTYPSEPPYIPGTEGCGRVVDDPSGEIAPGTLVAWHDAPGSYAEFIELSSIKEEPGLEKAPDWREMVRQLVVGNEAVCRSARKALEVADDADDDPTEDLLTQRLQTHEKNAWMLRSLLQ